MSLILVLVINIIIIFIVFVILHSRIRKNAAPALLEQYTREVENLIVQLNSAVDDVVNVAEDRMQELKDIIERAEKLLKNPKLKKLQPARRKPVQKSKASPEKTDMGDRGNLVERTRHLLGMGHSKDEIAQILGVSHAEVEFLESLSRK
jgi:ElaB/YqjD/DUF883 family membrane-anchored ribosome-binding protein